MWGGKYIADGSDAFCHYKKTWAALELLGAWTECCGEASNLPVCSMGQGFGTFIDSSRL